MNEKCCNLCGGPMDEVDVNNNFTIHKTVGYGSIHDMEEVNFRLCCKCFDKLMWQCAVNPITSSATENKASNCSEGYQ